ncbi:MAG: hypothetical protein ACYC49_10195 [Ignavibacteriaceae bacterium]
MFKKLYVAPAYRQASLRSFNGFFCLTATNVLPLCGWKRQWMFDDFRLIYIIAIDPLRGSGIIELIFLLQ